MPTMPRFLVFALLAFALGAVLAVLSGDAVALAVVWSALTGGA